MSIHKIGITIPLAAVIALAGAAPAAAQTDYPGDETVTIICPWPAGGASDTISRMMAAALQERLGGTFIVEKRPGASSGLGPPAVAQSAPDAHTLPSPTGPSSVPPHPITHHPA